MPKRHWIRRLRHAWTRNNGKPREQWAPDTDLKETVLIVASVLCVGLGAVLVLMQYRF